MKQERNTKIYDVLKSSFYALLLFVLLLGIIIYVSKVLNSPPLLFFLLICLFVIPFFFKKKFRRVFTKSILLEFSNHSFFITIYKSNSNDVERKVEYAWNSIKAYKISVTRSNLTCLDIYLKNGGFKEFFFDDSEVLEESKKKDTIIDIFSSSIAKYNSEISINEKIASSPGILNTRIGTFIFFILGALIITSIVLHIIKPNQSFAFLIIGLSMFISLFLKKIADKKNSAKENKLA